MLACARLGLLLLVLLALVISHSPSTLRATTPADIFGDGSDGARTFSTHTTDTPIDSPASGVSGSANLTATNPAFGTGQRILIHQSRGTNAGAWEMNEIQAYSAGTMTTVTPLANTYMTSGANAAQVLVVPQYTDLTVNAGVTVTAKAWNGSTGGIFAVLVNGIATIDGTISASARGYRGGQRGTQSGPGPAGNNDAGQGEGTAGPGATNGTYTRNGSGGGAGTGSSPLGGGGGGNDGTGSGGEGDGTISLVWYANTESDLGGYKVYYGSASRSYEHFHDVGIATYEGDNVYYELTGLSRGQTYYIAVTAYDIFRNESDFSDEISAIPN